MYCIYITYIHAINSLQNTILVPVVLISAGTLYSQSITSICSNLFVSGWCICHTVHLLNNKYENKRLSVTLIWPFLVFCLQWLSLEDSLPHAHGGHNVEDRGQDLLDYLSHVPAVWVVWLNTPATPASTKHVTGARNCHF